MSNDETQPVSGSRWEPEPGEAATPPAGPPAGPPAPMPSYAAAPVARSTRRPRRGTLLIAGAAAGIALLAGTGGFALGNATAGDGRDDIPARFDTGADQRGPQGFPGDRHDDGDRGLPPGADQDDPSGDDGASDS